MEGRFALGDFTLQSGEVLRDTFLSFETHGELNHDRSNAIVYPTWYSGTHATNRGAIGLGRALDPQHWFILVPDMFCNGLSSSPSNAAPPQDRARFPLITPYDNVVAQQRLCADHFGIERLALVAGFSMSAQQAFHWAALFPDQVGAIAPICGSARTSPHNWLFLEGVKRALRADAAWNGGDYESPPETGLRAFSTVYAGWCLSQTFFRDDLHLQFNNSGSMDGFLDNMVALFSKFDANDLLGMLATWQVADVANHPRFGGDLAKALDAIRCPAIVMPSATDLYFPPEDSEAAVALMRNSELRVIPSIHGHCAGLPGIAPPADDAFIDQALGELLAG